MKVFNLRCGQAHAFEGWFDSEEDFQTQQAGSMVACPLCADTAVVRLPAAPRLNMSSPRDEAPPPAADPQQELQKHWLRAMRHMIANTEDVGERFPEEARRMHYGEATERGIRGQATAEDANALREEGIEVVALPVLPGLKGPMQ